jgi:hypothetical protein
LSLIASTALVASVGERRAIVEFVWNRIREIPEPKLQAIG